MGTGRVLSWAVDVCILIIFLFMLFVFIHFIVKWW